MLTSSIIAATSLNMLHAGDRGVIARIQDSDPTVADQIRRLGLSPGISITLEQRFPRLIVQTRVSSVVLTQAMMQAIYVRTRTC
ncbi:FeoA family protein [cf. Phormidesmis sp. LEGE 11477]|uniref:FeoA family protein n=1 Tax=cf. Phormidesmis sp. LEGE 11477 TaxID=1828680 RepID=UPI00188272F8|nr:FeoA family protein [cf. Phormidesmis sp. LEGE 11477]MBE9059826.1 ferrous iron transport protein A [cf. Phormidesmis sp. LEGE 11477]